MTVLASACLLGAAVLVVVALRSASAAEPVLWVESAGMPVADEPTTPPPSPPPTTPADEPAGHDAAGGRDDGNDLEITVSDPDPTPADPSDVGPTATAPALDTEVPVDVAPLPPKQAPIAVTSSRATFGHSPVIPVGKEDDGKLEVPGADEIGWYKYGASPGRPGATVLAAHVSWNGDLGPFWELGRMQVGDVVDVTLKDGTVDRYSVTEVTMYPKDALPRERIWTETGPETLVLITCGGEFDDSINRYKHNIVVYATPIG
ncbi:MAG: class F sortase [Ilumatobacter sp.]|nr:class F sortase [Ilumatobacter sp.]